MSKVFELIDKESVRQQENIELIASENFVSENVLKVMGSCLTNKYAEGYPGHRYYGGCEHIDAVERYCKALYGVVFNTDYHVNVQPHSGANANLAAFMAVLKPGDTILSMDLNSGGHLTHGAKVNFSGKVFECVHYGLTENGFIDYSNLGEMLFKHHPKLVLAGASAYSRLIDFELIDTLIQTYKVLTNETVYFMVDMSHIAGLIAAGEHPSPFGVADIITTTTHKTLRGPRGGLIFCKPELASKIDSAVFPGTQGGPLMHVIAAKAVAAEEACTEEFKQYIHQVVKNSKATCEEFIKLGYHVITNGTDNHMFLIDLTNTGLTGKQVQEELDKHNITVNKNCVPNETRSPMQASGIRIGTAAMTTRGYKEDDFIRVARQIDEYIKAM